MKIILINLDRDTERLAYATYQFRQCGLEFERISGVVGDAVPDDLKLYFTYADERHITKGEIGCYASHIRAWQSVSGPTLICEDDIIIEYNTKQRLKRIIENAPLGWDIIKLTGETKDVVKYINSDLHQYIKIPTSCAAYLISRNGARKLLKKSVRTLPVDVDIRRAWLFDLNVYGVSQSPIRQINRNKSSIESFGRRYTDKRRRGARGLFRRMFAAERFQRLIYNVRQFGLLEYLNMIFVKRDRAT